MKKYFCNCTDNCCCCLWLYNRCCSTSDPVTIITENPNATTPITTYAANTAHRAAHAIPTSDQAAAPKSLFLSPTSGTRTLHSSITGPSTTNGSNGSGNGGGGGGSTTSNATQNSNAAPSNAAASLSSSNLVLIVDDDLINKKLLGRILREQGFQVEFAGNGKIAFEKCMKTSYKLIFMDIVMPIQNGIQATRNIRVLGENMETPIICHTSTPEKRNEALGAGMNSFITKPYKRAEIIEVVAQLLPTETSKPNANHSMFLRPTP